MAHPFAHTEAYKVFNGEFLRRLKLVKVRQESGKILTKEEEKKEEDFVVEPLKVFLDQIELSKVGDRLAMDITFEYWLGHGTRNSYIQSVGAMVENTPDFFGYREDRLRFVELASKLRKPTNGKRGRTPEFSAIREMSHDLLVLAGVRGGCKVDNPTKFKKGGTAFHEASDNMRKLGFPVTPKAIWNGNYPRKSDFEKIYAAKFVDKSSSAE